MDRSAWRILGIGLGLSVLSVILAFASAALPIEGLPQEAIVMAVLWPLFLIVRGLTGLFDSLGPAGLREPWSHFAPPWVVWVLIGLSSGLAVVGMVALADVARRRGARVAGGIWLPLTGVTLATNGLSESFAENAGSLQGVIGVAVALAGLYLLAVGISCRMKASHVAQWVMLGCLSAAVVGGAWLAYVCWLDGRS